MVPGQACGKQQTHMRAWVQTAMLIVMGNTSLSLTKAEQTHEVRRSVDC
jgi:hypothetical protein